MPACAASLFIEFEKASNAAKQIGLILTQTLPLGFLIEFEMKSVEFHTSARENLREVFGDFGAAFENNVQV